MSKNASTYLHIKWYEAARKFGCCTAENFQLQGKLGCNCTCIQASSSMEKAVFCAGRCSHMCTTSFCSAAVGTTAGQPEPDGRMLQGERRVNGIRSEGLGFFGGFLVFLCFFPDPLHIQSSSMQNQVARWVPHCATWLKLAWLEGWQTEDIKHCSQKCGKYGLTAVNLKQVDIKVKMGFGP